MKRVRRAALALLPTCALSWAIGCNAISGVDDLVPVAYSAEASVGDAPVEDAQVEDTEPPLDFDAHTHDFDTGASDSALPGDAGTVDANDGLCNGLTVLLRFENTTTSAQGQAPTSQAAVNFTGGKFGRGLEALGKTEIDYAAKNNKVVSSTEGTISMWVDSSWDFPCNSPHLFFEIDSNGLYLDCEDPGYLGVYVDLSASSSVFAAIAPASSTPVWTSGFNHIVATWSEKMGLTITLNGVVGQQTATAYTAPDPIASSFRIGTTGTATGVWMDDVAVWTRALSPAEINTIYKANVSVGDLCKLP